LQASGRAIFSSYAGDFSRGKHHSYVSAWADTIASPLHPSPSTDGIYDLPFVERSLVLGRYAWIDLLQCLGYGNCYFWRLVLRSILYDLRCTTPIYRKLNLTATESA